MRSLFLFLLAAVSACAQPFTAGVKLGATLTDFLNSAQSPTVDYHSGTNRYVLGATVEGRLPFGLGIEIDGLYRHYNFQSSGTISPAGTSLTTRGSTGAWEVPVLAKYRVPFPVVRPFIDAGAAWDFLNGYNQNVTATNLTIPVRPPENLNQPVHNTTPGVVIGAGLDVKTTYVHVSPEVRYTHWDSHHFYSPNAGFTSNVNQVEIMIGVTY
jgi:opacity protein-like surface antigen